MAHTPNRSSSDRCRAQCRSEPAGHHPSGPGVPTQPHRCEGADLPLDDVQAGSAAPGVTLYTAAQAAAVFQRTTRTLRNWVRSGLLRPIRVGRSLYFSEIELFRVINGGQAPPAGNPSLGAAEPTLPTGCNAVGTTDVNYPPSATPPGTPVNAACAPRSASSSTRTRPPSSATSTTLPSAGRDPPSGSRRSSRG